MFGEEHRHALVVSNPPIISVPAVREMRREQCEQAIVRQASFERFESYLLQNYAAVRIGQDLLVNAIAARDMRIRHAIRRDSRLKRSVFKRAMALLFGKEIFAVCDDEPHVARAGLIDAWEVNLVQNSVTQREPH